MRLPDNPIQCRRNSENCRLRNSYLILTYSPTDLDLAAMLQKISRLPENIKNKIGRDVRQKATTCFGQDKFISAYLNLFEEMVVKCA